MKQFKEYNSFHSLVHGVIVLECDKSEATGLVGVHVLDDLYLKIVFNSFFYISKNEPLTQSQIQKNNA